MENSPKKSPLSVGMLAGIAAVVVLGYGSYSYLHKSAPTEAVLPSTKEEVVQSGKSTETKEMTGQSEKSTAKTSSFNTQQQQEIQNIFLELIREKPELFMGAMNEGMQAQQDKLRIEMEKGATDMKDKLVSTGISLGSPQASVHMIAFMDPMCPHCHEFHKIVNVLLQKRQDIVIHVIPVAILGPNSVAMSKILIATAKQGADKMNNFFNKFISKTSDIDRTKLLQMAKDSGVDVAKMEKEEVAEETEKTLIAYTQLAEQLKVPGVPTVFGVQKDGKVVIVPPMDIDGFNKAIDSLKGVEEAAVADSPKAVAAENETVKADVAAIVASPVKSDAVVAATENAPVKSGDAAAVASSPAKK
jgi:protein-disulfide isomerase